MRYDIINKLGQEEIGKASTSFSKFKFALHPILDELAELSIHDPLKYGISVYDSSYLALSKTFDKELYTVDEKLLSKVAGKERVVHLNDY